MPHTVFRVLFWHNKTWVQWLRILDKGLKGKILEKFGFKNFRLVVIFASFYAKSLSHSQDLILDMLHRSYNLSNVKNMSHE